MPRPILPEPVWSVVKEFIPVRPDRPKGGRPPLGDREALTGILFVLRTGMAWPELPKELACGCGITCLRRLREWQNLGAWSRISECLREQLEHAHRIDWERAEVDAPADVEAPCPVE